MNNYSYSIYSITSLDLMDILPMWHWNTGSSVSPEAWSVLQEKPLTIFLVFRQYVAFTVNVYLQLENRCHNSLADVLTISAVWQIGTMDGCWTDVKCLSWGHIACHWPNQNPKPELVPSSSPPPLPSPPPSRFLHRLQTSITRSIIKLECFLRPFLKTRSHDESATYFQIQSPIFGSAPKRGFKKIIFLHFFTTFFYTFGLIGSVKTFSKVLGVGMNVGPYMAYILYQ